jgi:hypothetical protein
MTFDATATQVSIISPGSSLQDQEVEEVDEVSCLFAFVGL